MASPAFSRRQVLAYAFALSAALPITACSSSNASSGETEPSETASSAKSQKIFRFANAAPAASLDVGRHRSLETRRISQQILDTLVQPNPDTSAPEPALAESWEVNETGTQVTFTIRSGVNFHNGEALTPEVVVQNTKRWQLLAQQTHQPASYPYRTLFAALDETAGAQPVVTKVEATEKTVVFTLSRPSSLLLSALTQAAFGIVAPASWNSKGYLLKEPVGTGAFSLSSWENQTAELKTNHNYWGEVPTLDGITFTAISTGVKRYYALLNNDIDAYDQVDKNDFVPLAKAGLLVQSRDPFASVSLDFNINHPALSNVYVRRAISHAIDRNHITGTFLAEGSYGASSFIPRSLQIPDDDLGAYFSHKPELARALLERSGYQNEPITFYYPTGTSLTALPHPEALYADVAASLAEIGLNIVPRPVAYQDGYYEQINSTEEDRGIALIEHFGTYRDPAAFIEQLVGHLPEGFFSTQLTLRKLLTLKEAELLKPVSAESEQSKDNFELAEIEIPDMDAQPLEMNLPAQLLKAILKADVPAETDELRESNLAALKLWCALMPATPLAFSVSSLVQRGEVTSLPISISGVAPLNRVAMK